ncbi:hypothetical protein D9M68_921170 [compost metagenome]
MLGAGELLKQLHAKNAVHRIRRQADGECRALKSLDPFQQVLRVVGRCVIEHVLRRVGRQNHPVRVFGQHRPKAPGPASHVEDQAWLASRLERVTHQLLVTPERQAPGEST